MRGPREERAGPPARCWWGPASFLRTALAGRHRRPRSVMRRQANAPHLNESAAPRRRPPRRRWKICTTTTAAARPCRWNASRRACVAFDRPRRRCRRVCVSSVANKCLFQFSTCAVSVCYCCPRCTR